MRIRTSSFNFDVDDVKPIALQGIKNIEKNVAKSFFSSIPLLYI